MGEVYSCCMPPTPALMRGLSNALRPRKPVIRAKPDYRAGRWALAAGAIGWPAAATISDCAAEGAPGVGGGDSCG